MNTPIDTSGISSDRLVDTDDVQALLLHASKAHHVLHSIVHFESAAAGQKFFKNLAPEISWGEANRLDESSATKFELSVGITFKGLQALEVPQDVLHLFRRLAPAFSEGATARAAKRLGDVGASAARYWDDIFAADNVHAIVTIHGSSCTVESIKAWGENTLMAPLDEETRNHIVLFEPLSGERLAAPGAIEQHPEKEKTDVDPWHDPRKEIVVSSSKRQPAPMWVHFGYRDGLTSNRIRTRKNLPDTRNIHEPGELLLGEPRNAGDNPWNLVGHSNRIRAFFRHGSFGVVRRIEQDEKAFREQVATWVDELNQSPYWSSSTTLSAFVRAKLCGRWPNGQVIKVDEGPDAISERPIDSNDVNFFTKTSASASSEIESDAKGKGCPFASHIRRMNPRDESGAQMHRRPVFRRGMPYGPWYKKDERADVERGLLGVFFCADLEMQFEHLLGEWSDRLPLGMPGDRAQKDPLIGAHTNSHSSFTINRRSASGEGDAEYESYTLQGFRQFVRTRGTAYCFYPSKSAFEQLGGSSRID